MGLEDTDQVMTAVHVTADVEAEDDVKFPFRYKVPIQLING